MSHMISSTTVAVALAAALFAACDKKPGTPPQPKSETVAAANISKGIVTDPSVPPASQVLGEQPAPAAAGQDTAAQRPNEELRKDEERNTMPKAQHGNNHSSTSLDGAQQAQPQQPQDAPQKQQ